jgi:hypothetical protein
MNLTEVQITQLIQQYNVEWKNELETRLKKIAALSDSDFLDALRKNNHSKNMPTLPHAKSNVWYNKKQIDKTGEPRQLRDAFIAELTNSDILNNKSITTFEEIFTQVSNIFRRLKDEGLKGAAQMTIYDISLYIAAKKKTKPPQDVYIHRGVRNGAFALNIIPNKNKDFIIPLDEVVLKCPCLKLLGSANHVENFLCIKKTQLAN